MSDVFDQIGKAAQRAVSGVANEVSIAALEQRVNDAYRDLGRQYYDTVRQGEKPEGKGFDAHMDRIGDLLGQIREKRRNRQVSDDV